MKAGIVGLPLSGKSTLFEALTGHEPTETLAGKDALRAVEVVDERLAALGRHWQPKKLTPARVELVDFGRGTTEAARLGSMREADALIYCLRAFTDSAVPYGRPVDPVADIEAIEADFIISDMALIEGRIDKLNERLKKPVPTRDRDASEKALLEEMHGCLDAGRLLSELALSDDQQEWVRGYGLLSQKPRVLVLNHGDGGAAPEVLPDALRIAAKLEAELWQFEEEERAEFMAELGLETLGRDAILAGCMAAMGLICFFTMGEKEVRAWPLRKGSNAVEAAGRIHTDLARGFIRADVVAYDEVPLDEPPRMVPNQRKSRLEGKDYLVRDGDVLEIRFSV